MRRSQGDLETKRIARREKKKRHVTGIHTKKTDEAFGSLQEGEGVDALISDGNIREGLRRRVRLGLAKTAMIETHGNGVKIGCHVTKKNTKACLNVSVRVYQVDVWFGDCLL
jgi:hypothetical protein